MLDFAGGGGIHIGRGCWLHGAVAVRDTRAKMGPGMAALGAESRSLALRRS
jgi:hypothetical protein